MYSALRTDQLLVGCNSESRFVVMAVGASVACKPREHETDAVENEVIRRSELETELDGDLPITEFLEMYGISEDEFEADSDTIGGWTIESFGGRFPEAGESFSFGDLKISVLAMDGRRVERVLVKKKPKEPEENGKN